MTDPLVALINPGVGKPWASIHAPMNLGVLASYARRNGVQVEIVDELAGQDVAVYLRSRRPDVVGLSSHRHGGTDKASPLPNRWYPRSIRSPPPGDTIC